MLADDKIYLGNSTHPEYLALKYGNRHGLVTGATGTGKTVTLQVLAEGFSAAGVPVFAADIKGDLSGVAKMGKAQGWQTERAKEIGFDDYKDDVFPVIFWDLFGRQGHPIRATISEMGALLLSRMLELNDTQEGVLNIAFKVADDEGLLLLDMKDLRALLIDIQQRAKDISVRYGNVTTASIGAVQRALLVLEQQGAENFFGERALEIADLMRTDRDGRGFISILAADELMRAPRLYATFLLWMLSELFEALPEVGDPDKPKLVFFFDEAHLLFDGAPKVLVDKVEQVVKLVRSKGVGVYFVTQNPVDIPESVLAQLSNRVQHALRAYTPREQKAVKVAADTFRPNPDFSTAEVITQLGIGEALVSVLEAKGIPSMVGRTLIRPPSAQVGPLLPEERRAIMANSPVAGLYDTMIDRDSAFEVLARKAKAQQDAAEQQRIDAERAKLDRSAPASRTATTARAPSTPRASTRQTPAEAAMNSLARTVANRLGNALVRGILGSLKRGK
ncbi:ATP-binding protein [Devosia epidermidihirudinis]|uniref:ATP-binding protein n=1 Tax=Devosia epidermidihirudinis TaxID=1293439 RepID=A0A0F5QGK9_9HYPH|nr:helicase HerA-like C-terminal domain-containing protein [Devosia epidermidihirudinis]KKC39848.1 ATP-binding protein [Devosia epidermidihirudinis]